MRTEQDLQITQQRSYLVVKANEIIQKARYDLNITELKILAFVISKVKPTDTELQSYKFSVNEFCQVCGIDEGNGKNYRHIKDVLQKLRNKSFWVRDENGAEVLVGWLQTARIYKGSGMITVKLDEAMRKYVIGLFSDFTQYELLSTLPMKSAYSFRMYELLKSYAYQKEHTFKIDDLKKQLAAECYVNFKDFRRFVLEIATREINKYTDLEVSWEPETFGRKVVEITFEIRQRDAWGRLEAADRANEQLDGQMTMFDYLEQ